MYLLILENLEAVIGPNEQIPGEEYKFNEKVKIIYS